MFAKPIRWICIRCAFAASLREVATGRRMSCAELSEACSSVSTNRLIASSSRPRCDRFRTRRRPIACRVVCEICRAHSFSACTKTKSGSIFSGSRPMRFSLPRHVGVGSRTRRASGNSAALARLASGGVAEEIQRLRIHFLTPTELKGSREPEFGPLLARIRDRISTLRALVWTGSSRSRFPCFRRSAR